MTHTILSPFPRISATWNATSIAAVGQRLHFSISDEIRFADRPREVSAPITDIEEWL